MIYLVKGVRLQVVLMARYMKFEDITFLNFAVYHYTLDDNQNCIITGYILERNYG
jgi:hypothetical protein